MHTHYDDSWTLFCLEYDRLICQASLEDTELCKHHDIENLIELGCKNSYIADVYLENHRYMQEELKHCIARYEKRRSSQSTF